LNKGAILIITLWILAILAILSIGIGGRMGLELKLTGLNRDSTAALYLAKAGVKRATAVVVNSHTNQVNPVDSLKMGSGSCANNDEKSNPLFKDINVGEAGTFTVSYVFPDKRVIYGVQDEAARVNINNAPHYVIAGLVSCIDPTLDAEAIAANIEDWRGSGNNPQDYSDKGYSTKNALFDSVDEVMLVKGVDQNLFDKIKGYITVYPIITSGCQINVNTAPLPVLEALGFSGTAAASIISARAGPDGVEGTADDTPFISKDAFTTYLSSSNLAAAFTNTELVSCGSNFFRIVSKGYASSGRVVRTVTCVISAQTGEILYWNEE
jgi:type II secretory pathway component PulK